MSDPTAASASASLARAAFRGRLDERPLLLDGAMGTLLWSRGVPQRASLDELVLRRPELIGAIHREYLEAGVDIIETHTFGANRIRLEPAGLADRTVLLNRRAAQLARDAREVAARDVLVAGSIGPAGSPLRGPGRISDDEAEAAVFEQVEGLLEGGVDLLVLETAGDLGHLLAGVRAARRLADLPLVACLTFDEDLSAADGTAPQQAAAALLAAGVDAMGVNCGSGPIASVEALGRMSQEAGGVPLVIMPNAGLPSRVEGSFVYAADAAYFGAAVPGFIEAGARLVGGCCGTTPSHLSRMRAALDAELARRAGTRAARSAATGRGLEGAVGSTHPPGMVPPEPAAGPRPTEAGPPPTGLARALAERRFVISVEIDPPRSIRIERTVEAAVLLRESGVDLVNISDSAMARVRMGALAVAFALQRDADLECLVHVTTRDRNLMALESELLGAHALGIRNILALTGDPPGVADYPGGTGIWDIDSTGLIGVLGRLNRGEDQAGRPIGAPAGFTIACALDPTAADLDRELDRLTGKMEAGAHLIMTQPIFALEQWERFMERAAGRFGPRLPRPVLLGILPLHTARHAEFLHHEVPGITIPDAVRRSMHEAGEQGAAVGLEMAVALLDRMRPLVDGTYVMPSFGRYEMAVELVRRLGADLVAAGSGSGAAGSGSGAAGSGSGAAR